MNQTEPVAKPDLLPARSVDPSSAETMPRDLMGLPRRAGHLLTGDVRSRRVSGCSTREQMRLDGLTQVCHNKGKTCRTHDNIPWRSPSPQPLCACPGLPAERVAAALQLYCSLLCRVSSGLAVTCEHSLNLRSGHQLPPLRCVYARGRKRPSTGDMSQ